jgi:hypothetical protein
MAQDNPWLKQCLENIKRIPGGVPCSELRCSEVSPYMHAVCNCLPPYTNGCSGQKPPPNCCAYSGTTPIAVFGPSGVCYCCCFGVALGPMLSTSASEVKSTHELNVGDKVLTASGPGLQHWSERPVAFSSGAGPDPFHPMIVIRYGDERTPHGVLAAPNQPFLLPGGKLKRASQLVPDKDELVRPDGSSVRILETEQHVSGRGYHRIAVATAPASDIAGHLVIANGVVCGDYALELADLEGKLSHHMA